MGARHKQGMMDPAASIEDIEHGHSAHAIAARLEKGPQANYIQDWVFGGIDGAVTTFAIVAGVAGAELSVKIILILGLANLLADGFSMAAGNYSGVKAQKGIIITQQAVEGANHFFEGMEEVMVGAVNAYLDKRDSGEIV